jgi:hypothetical protein
MTLRRNWIVAGMAALVPCLTLTSCDKGTFEEAGEKVDEAVDKAENKIDEAEDKVEDAVDEATDDDNP